MINFFNRLNFFVFILVFVICEEKIEFIYVFIFLYIELNLDYMIM